MNAVEIVGELRKAGAALNLDGENIRLKTPVRLPESLLEEVRRQKPQIVDLLRSRKPRSGKGPCSPDWTDSEDVKARFYEMAGHHLSDGKLQEEADRLAGEILTVQYMNDHPPEPTSPDRCAHCSKISGENDTVPVLAGLGGAGHVWLHSQCHGPWMENRRAEAEKTLSMLGVDRPVP